MFIAVTSYYYIIIFFKEMKRKNKHFPTDNAYGHAKCAHESNRVTYVFFPLFESNTHSKYGADELVFG